jgi:hypothetical protein
LAQGKALDGVKISFDSPDGGRVNHFVVAPRSVVEDFSRRRVTASDGDSFSLQSLGFNPGDSFFISVAAANRQGHESLVAYPEVRCDSKGCAIPASAFNVTAPLPPPPPAKDDAEHE